MTLEEVMTELKAKGSESIKKILLKHGIKEPFFGVKVEYLKVLQKKIKKDYPLSKELYETGNADAMYLAGLIADEDKMTKKDLSAWVKKAVSTNISEYTVPWIAAESHHGFELALEWIDAKVEFIAAAGWATLSNLMALTPDDKLDLTSLKSLLNRVHKTIHHADNRVRSTMNAFVIAVGSYVAPLTDYAMGISEKIGEVTINVGDTACRVPNAKEYITKVRNKGTTGKKKKTVRC